MFAYRQGHIDDCNFKCLFDTYKSRLYSYVFAITHSAYVAEEITQEIFIKLWICRDLLDQVENMDGYLFVIARNKTLNYLRKAANDAKLLHELQGQMALEDNNVEEHANAYDYGRLLQEALTLLSPQRRLVYRLSRNNGLNYQEIAS
jgi:RNA polymerase sigma factor (sigma-70 family)